MAPEMASSFQFDWTPPATNAGPVTLYVAGNAANGNDANMLGDLIYTTSVQLTPVIPAAPTVTAGNIVSAATCAAGPIAAEFVGHDLRYQPLRHHARVAG